MRALVRLVGLLALAALAGALLLAATFAMLAGFSATWRDRAEPPETAPLVIVLGGGVNEEGELHPRSRDRLTTALRLFEEGRTRRLHFTGGGPGAVAEAEAMRERALAEGVPEDAISIETASTTTLQNVVFTLDAIGVPPPGTVIVTDISHLPRAWLSFRWAGVRGHAVYPGDPWPNETRENRLAFIGRETLAFWYNLGRMARASAQRRLGVDRATIMEGLGRADAAWGAPP